MSRTHAKLAISAALIGLLPAMAAAAETPFFFSTGTPDGKIATATRPDTGAPFEIESADDFVLTHSTSITNATFTGLVPAGATVGEVVVEIYRVFPKDSDIGRTSGPPTFSTTQVPTRVNSPSDVAFDSRELARQPQFFDGRAKRQFHRAQLGDTRRHPSQTWPDDRRQRSCHRRGGTVRRDFRHPLPPPRRPLFLCASGPAVRRRLSCGCPRPSRSSRRGRRSRRASPTCRAGPVMQRSIPTGCASARTSSARR